MNNCVTTLRSGRKVDNKVAMPDSEHAVVHPYEPENEETDRVSKETNEGPVEPHFVPRAPFPQLLVPTKRESNFNDILEVFKQVNINLPLLDAIRQIPSYAKFLKDLCTRKRKLSVQKKAFIASHVSSIIQNTTTPKYKDPGSPTISCTIGKYRVEKALLDLGASVNLLPYHVYLKLGLGEMKPTQMTLQLADRSVKIPRGVIEDVLIEVNKFIYPVDFVILDTQPVPDPENQIPVILGRPFLATSNAIINCRNGIMNLSFGNMTIELNIFNISKLPSELDDSNIEEVNMIGTLVEESLPNTLLEDPLEKCLAHFGIDFDDDDVINEVNALLDSTPLLDTSNIKNLSDDALKLRLFPFSLKDKAKSWLYSLESESIETYDQLTYAFIQVFRKVQ